MMNTSRFAGRGSVLLPALLSWAALLPTPGPALADGGFFPPEGREIWESSQIAFLRLDEGREQLSILPGFHGDARDFAWVVPVPALPELDSADPYLFSDLGSLTYPLYRHRDRDWGCQDTYGDYGIGAPDGVQVIAEELVGIYRAMIVGADDAQVLVDSLTVWGFLDSGNSGRILPVLEHYVDEAWYFVTLKVDQDTLEEGFPDLPYYWYGQMQPIRLAFDVEVPVYPLRISSLSAAERSDVVIYAAGDHRMTFPGAETRYANRISASEREAILRRYPSAGAELAAGDFLTKLVRRYTPEQMTGDLVLERADDDDEFRPVYYGGFPLFTLLLSVSVLGWLAYRIVRRPGRRGD